MKIPTWLSYPQWLFTALVFLTASWWWRPYWLRDTEWLPAWMRSTDLYFLHFGYTPLLVFALIAWALTGFRGLGSLASGINIFWGLLIIQLALWALISLPPDARNRMVGFAGGVQLMLVMLFALSILANAPPRRVLIGALVGGMLFQAMIGMAQVAVQGDIGVHDVVDERLKTGIELYELRLDPERSGVSVVQSGGVRYLRPYGVSAHPNLLAGVLVMGCLVTLSLPRRTAATVGVIGVWALLLTFSRAALGALLIGVGVWGVLLFLSPSNSPRKQGEDLSPLPRLRGKGLGERGLVWMQRIAPVIVGAILIVIPFMGLYYPLISVRSGAATEGSTQSVEAMSIASRAVYRDQAVDLIRENPVRGVGIGNFSWESAWLLQDDWRDLRGDHVHNIYLLVTAELGIVGFSLWAGAILLGSGAILWRAWQGRLEMAQIGLFAGVIAWLALGWFDHYPWTQFGYLILFWSSYAGALADSNPRT